MNAAVYQAPKALRIFTKVLALFSLLLVFKGALVKSHEAGLAVPDWPTTFGENMFLFPLSQWTGLVFYEHGHRVLASFVGLLTVIVAIWIQRTDPRRWARLLAWGAVVAVILQGLLGGLTVIYLLPAAVSSAHGILGQTFLALTFFIAYSQSLELTRRVSGAISGSREGALGMGLLLLVLFYFQLIVGAFMRHLEAGLAAPDFPTAAGSLLPAMGAQALATANELRAALGLREVGALELHLHITHRWGGYFLYLVAMIVALWGVRQRTLSPLVRRSVIQIGALVNVQVLLGIFTIVSGREPWVTSLHVVTGALLLSLVFVFLLRSVSFEGQGKAS